MVKPRKNPEPTRFPNSVPRVSSPVLDEIRRRLASSPYAAIRKLECSTHEGVVILRGNVPTYHTRQVAQVLVRDVTGVEKFDDRITVDASDSE